MTTGLENERLRYLDATQVVHPAGTLAGVEVCTADDESLGSIDGVLVEPGCRRLRYFVVERAALLARRRRYLVPADGPNILNREDGKLYVETDTEDVERFEPKSVRRFSDDDLIDALFSTSAA